MEVTLTYDNYIDFLIIALELIVPFVILVVCAWRQETLKRKHRNEIIKTFFEFDTWED